MITQLIIKLFFITVFLKRSESQRTTATPPPNINDLYTHVFGPPNKNNTNENLGDCECVHYYRCDPETNLIRIYGEEIFDVRFSDKGLEKPADPADSVPPIPGTRECADNIRKCCVRPPGGDGIYNPPSPPPERPCENEGSCGGTHFTPATPTSPDTPPYDPYPTKVTPPPPPPPRTDWPETTPSIPYIPPYYSPGTTYQPPPTHTEYTPPYKTSSSPPPVPKFACGQRNEESAGVKISNIGAEGDTTFGEFPWMVAVLRKANRSSSIAVYMCGGSIIHNQVILTAAHCVFRKDPSSILIRAGEWDTQSEDEILEYQQQYVQEIIMHNKYNPGNLHNDIALLILENPLRFDEHISPVCLPPQGQMFDYESCWSSGWGKEKNEEFSKYKTVLRKVDLPIVPNQKCQSDLRKTRLGNAFRLSDTFICAGGVPGKDTCKGDGGGPLVCPIKNTYERYQQAGIVAWGIGCASETPGVYANVAGFRNWVDYHMDRYNFEHQYEDII